MAVGDNEQSTLEGGFAGAGTGAGIGASIGAVAGGVGALPGAAIGAAIGFAGGALLSNSSAQKARRARAAAEKKIELARRQALTKQMGATAQADAMALSGLRNAVTTTSKPATTPSGSNQQGTIGANVNTAGTF